MFRTTKILLVAMCVMAIGSVQAGLTKYFGVPKTSASSKGDRIAKYYYWSGALRIYDNHKALWMDFSDDDWWWAYDYAWSPVSNEIIVFYNPASFRSSNPFKRQLCYGYRCVIYSLDNKDEGSLKTTAFIQYGSPLKQYSIDRESGILKLLLEDESEVKYDLKNHTKLSV